MNLDTYARAPLWDRKTDYNHGTGHGIGYILNVHEGPQNIRWKAGHGGDQIFLPGMITSDEPGIYREGKWGIRTETITECVDEGTGEFGRFLSFRPLTFVPVDLEAVLTEEMDRSDIDRLNRYHKMVREKIAPYLEGEELEFLNRSTVRS
jgi:Xaa-Pro aminopeptidase